MIFEIVFNEDVSRRQLEMLHDLAWRKKKNYWRNAHFLGVLLLILGIAIIYGKSGLGYLLAFFGAVHLIGYYYIDYKSKSSQRKLFDNLEKNKSKYGEDPIAVFEFGNDEFKYIDCITETSTKWEDFKTYIQVDDVVFMITKTYQPFIFQENEVGEDNFKKIIKFISEKICSKSKTSC